MIIASLARLPKVYALIRTVILARESSITLKEFRVQFLGAEETEGETNVLSQNLFALYIQGSNSYQGSSSASGSNLVGHNHLSTTIGDTIAPSPYNNSSHFQYPHEPYNS